MMQKNGILLQNFSVTLPNQMVIGPLTQPIDKSKLILIKGKNGSGKTSFIEALLGLNDLASGQCEYTGRVAYVPDQGGLLPELTVLENIEFYFKIHRLNVDIGYQLKYYYELDKIAHCPVASLSLGQQQQLKLAQSFMISPDVLFLDEPSNALDENSIHKLLAYLRTCKNNETIIIVSSHIPQLIEPLANYQLDLDQLHPRLEKITSSFFQQANRAIFHRDRSNVEKSNVLQS